MATKAVSGLRDERKRSREKKRAKRIEEAVQYALNHVSRLEILILLNEQIYTKAELSKLTGIDLVNVANHVKRMLDDGSIEVAKIEERRGTNVHWYRAVKIPYYSREDAESMTEMELQMIAGLIVQGGTAEVMAALHKGTLADPRTILSWDWYNVDSQGRDEIEEEVVRHLERLKEIACDSANRVVVSNEDTTTIVASVSAFVRARKAQRPHSLNSDPGQVC